VLTLVRAALLRGGSGSREKLMQCRRISMRDYCSHRLDQRKDPMAAFSTKRCAHHLFYFVKKTK
jgi:hypothetical protein